MLEISLHVLMICKAGLSLVFCMSVGSQTLNNIRSSRRMFFLLLY